MKLTKTLFAASILCFAASSVAQADLLNFGFNSNSVVQQVQDQKKQPGHEQKGQKQHEQKGQKQHEQKDHQQKGHDQKDHQQKGHDQKGQKQQRKQEHQGK